MTLRNALTLLTGLLVLGASMITLPVRAADAKLPVAKDVKIWLTADAGVTKDATDKVSVWTSQVDPKTKFTQDNAEMQPLFVKDGLNGNPVLRFDGLTDYVQGVAGINFRTSPYTIFVVANPTGPVYDWKTYLSSECFRYSSNNISYKDGGALGKKTPTVASVQTAVRDAEGQITLFENGAQVATWNVETGTTDGVNLRIGGDGLSKIGTADMFAGDIAEVIIYNAALSAADMATMSKYLQTKYKIVTPAPKP